MVKYTGTLLNGWRIGNLIGSGQRTQVYEARGAGGVCAIKIFNSPVDYKAFEQEVSLLQKLGNPSHPQIAHELESHRGTDGSPPYIAFELMQSDLRKELSAKSRLPLEESVSILRQVLCALGFVHGHSVMHLDVKPEKILMNRSPAGIEVKLTDFHLAQKENNDDRLVFQSGPLPTKEGTTRYAAPEQIGTTNALVNYRADLYSAGVVFHELVTGEIPAYGILPSQLIRGLPVWVDTFVGKALRVKPEDRYASASEMLAVLETAVLPVCSPVKKKMLRAIIDAPLPEPTVNNGPLLAPEEVIILSPLQRKMRDALRKRVQ